MQKLGKGSIQPAIRQGGVYWVDNIAPLDGGKSKARWLIVVEDNDSLKAGADPVVVVACSTTVRDTEPDRIKLPSKADTPTCRSGLTQTCWAMPRWRFPIDRSKLTDYRGKIQGITLKRVVEAYLRRAGVLPPADPKS